MTTRKLPIAVYFSPNGRCTDSIVHELEQARRMIRVQAYSFTSGLIANALCAAKRRGVDVRVIVDPSYAEKPKISILRKAGIRVLVDRKHSIAHNKIIVIDDWVVITGSFNFTYAAETKNSENVLVIHNSNIAELYMNNWNQHGKHSK